MNEDLPSINDFIEDRSELPSINEGVESELPSYKDFLEEKVEEVVADIDDQYSHHFEQAQPAQPVVQTDLSSVITLIEGVRNSIPEVKSYDKELYELMTLIEELRKEIPVIPEFPDVKYYDKEIQELKESIPTVPEVKYYDQEIKELKESISEVKDRYIPDFRWIIKTFSQLDENYETLSDTIATVRGKLSQEVTDMVESVEVAKFEAKVDVENIDKKFDITEESIVESKKELTQKLNEVKEKIYEQLRDSSVKIYTLNKEYKTDSKKLKEETLNQYQELKEKVETSIDGIVQKTDKDYIEISEYFSSLRSQIDNLPKVKYYDDEIKEVNESVKSVRSLLEVFEEKLNKKIEDVKEGLLNIPPSENNSDPLTPLDQNFVTFNELQSHYKIFVNRVQQQLSTLGGGGEVWLQYLDDVDRDSVKVDGRVLIYNSTDGKWVGIGSTELTPGDAGIDEVLEIGNTSARGMSVGFVTATGASFSGNVTIGGTLTYEDVKNVDSLGIVTARIGIDADGVINAENLQVTGITTLGTSNGIGTVTVGVGTTALLVEGSARVTGILTVGTDSVTIDGVRSKVHVGSGITIHDGSGIHITGILTAQNFHGDGSNLTGLSTQLSQLDNNVGFVTFTNLSQLSDDVGFVTSLGDGSALAGVVTEGRATEGQILQHNGSNIVGVSSVGLATFFNDQQQGYYRYSTNYYTTGVANTVQSLPADEFVLVQPAVRTNRTTYMPQVMLDANNGDPWIGAGATIGTGQTTFSLAGLDEGSTVLVRIASQFNPDIDNTNVDFKLEFTTNPTTQGFGVTNFDITREQALVCNEGAEQPYISETLINFYVGNSLSGMTTETAGMFKLCVRASDEGDFEMMALTVNVVA